MKKIENYYLIIAILFCFNSKSQVVTTQKLDTIRWYNLICITGTKDGKRFYSANDILVDSARFIFLQNKCARNPTSRCKPCYLIELNTNDEVINEGLSYKGTPIGVYKEYYFNRRLKISGTYKNIYPLTHEAFKFGGCIGTCTVKDGEWKYYSDKGKLTKTEKYKEGKLIKK